jgi:hypothetical protein
VQLGWEEGTGEGFDGIAVWREGRKVEWVKSLKRKVLSELPIGVVGLDQIQFFIAKPDSKP